MQKNLGAAYAAACRKSLQIMKLTTLCLFLGCVQVSATAYSQDHELTLHADHVELSRALRMIEKKSPYRFLYNDALLSPSMVVNIRAEDRSVTDVVGQLLSGTPLTYTLIGDHLIVIGTRDAKVLALQLRGQVTDSAGAPLAGVTIQVKGTTLGTVTDADGRFALDVPEGGVIAVSAIGYQTRELTVTGEEALHIVLQPSAAALNEVVVVGYGTQTKKDITGSISVISADDIANRPIVNLGEALQGKAAGIQVTANSGKPGAGLTIRVRGSSSISAGNDPLYVVDGIPMTDISSYSPDDIASISVLKDAASAAIYGTRAANGVVVITTKKGVPGQSRVTFGAYYGISSPTRKVPVLNAAQYKDYMQEAFGTDPASLGSADVNWPDEVFRTGQQSNYHLAFSGGSDKTQHYLSLGYTDQVGMIRPATYNRLDGRLNLSTQVTPWLKLSTSTVLSRAKDHGVTDNQSVARGGVVLSGLTTPPTVPRYTDNGQVGQNPSTGWENPLGAIEGQKDRSTTDRLVANLGADLQLARGLAFHSKLGIDYLQYRSESAEDPWLTQDGRNQEGQFSQENSNTLVWLSEQTLDYQADWGPHHLTALAGWTAQNSRWNQTTLYARGLDTAYRHKPWDQMYTRAVTKSPATKRIDEWALISWLGRITYNFSDKYLLQANIRSDQSSKFAKHNRVATFPSFSAGWRLSQEPFMRDLRAVTDLKLRVGWGQNGNQEGIGSYEYLSLNNINTNGNTVSIDPATIAPEDLRWETTTQTDVGVDASFLQGRLSFTGDFYLKKTRDVLVAIPLSSQIVPSVVLNMGSMKNVGEEFTVSSRNIEGRDFRWSTDLNLSFNQNTVTSIGNGISFMNAYGSIYERGNAIALVQGYGLGEFFGYIAAGVDPQTGEQLYLTHDGKKVPYSQARPSDGRLLGDQQLIGSAQPDFIYGMTNRLQYKGLDLTVFIQGSQGNEIYNGVRVETEGMKDSRNQSTAVLDRWRKPGDVTNIPGVSPASNDNTVISTRFLENGSYLRFKTITLTYHLPEAWLNRIGLGAASVYVSGQNLITITSYTGFDPEVNTYGTSTDTDQRNIALGVDYGAYPQAKMVLFGLNLSLK